MSFFKENPKKKAKVAAGVNNFLMRKCLEFGKGREKRKLFWKGTENHYLLQAKGLHWQIYLKDSLSLSLFILNSYLSVFSSFFVLLQKSLILSAKRPEVQVPSTVFFWFYGAPQIINFWSTTWDEHASTGYKYWVFLWFHGLVIYKTSLWSLGATGLASNST